MSIGAARGGDFFCNYKKNTTVYLLTRDRYRQCFSFPPQGFPWGGCPAASEKWVEHTARGGVKGANVRPLGTLSSVDLLHAVYYDQYGMMYEYTCIIYIIKKHLQ